MNVERFHLALGQAVALRRTETVIQFALFMAEIERLERECYAARLLHAQTFRHGDFMIARDLLVGWECAPFRDGDVVKAGEEFFVLGAPTSLGLKITYKRFLRPSDMVGSKKAKGHKPKKAKRCQAKTKRRRVSRRRKRNSSRS